MGWLPSRGGPGDLTVHDEEADPGAAVGDQPVQRRRARAQRRLPGQDLLLEGALVVLQQCLEDRPHPPAGRILRTRPGY
jgi:hypothetical protein